MPDFDENGKFAEGNQWARKKGDPPLNPTGIQGPSIKRQFMAIFAEEEGDKNGEKAQKLLALAAIKAAVGNSRTPPNFQFFQFIYHILDGKIPDRIANADGGLLGVLDPETRAIVDAIVKAADTETPMPDEIVTKKKVKRKVKKKATRKTTKTKRKGKRK